jgi:hypothetical protein
MTHVTPLIESPSTATVPPIGACYGLDLIVDDSIQTQPEAYMEALACTTEGVCAEAIAGDHLFDGSLAFSAYLRMGTCRATATQDASVIGPLIRANLVRWDDDPSKAVGRREPTATPTLLPTSVSRAWPSMRHRNAWRTNGGHR